MSYPDFPVIDRRDYHALINVVRAAQKRDDYEMAAIALAIMVHATPWRSKDDRKVDLSFVHPNVPTSRGHFLFFLRNVDGRLPPKKYSWVRFPTHLFTGDIASALTYEALQNEQWSLVTVREPDFNGFKTSYPREPIPPELVHPDGCLEVIRRNKKQFQPSDFETVLSSSLAEQCLKRFVAPAQFLF